MQKLPDLEKEHSEKKHTLLEFLNEYNDGLPKGFPRATQSLLIEFQKLSPHLFKDMQTWTLDVHRKKFMDWLPQRLREQKRNTS